MDANVAIKKIREIDCREHCEGIAKSIPHKGCLTCRAGASIEALEIIAFDAKLVSRGMMKPEAAINEIRGEECSETCKSKGLSVPNENCGSCRWGVSVQALEKMIQEMTCPICGTDLLGNELRINDTVGFSVGKNRVQGIIQTVTKGGMLKINCLIGEFRRKPESVVKLV